MRGIERRVAIDHGSGLLLLYPIENTWLVCCSLLWALDSICLISSRSSVCVGECPKLHRGVRPSVRRSVVKSESLVTSISFRRDAGTVPPMRAGRFHDRENIYTINETRRRKKGRMASRRTRWNCERSATPEKRKWTDFGDVSITVAKLHPCEKKVSI